MAYTPSTTLPALKFFQWSTKAAPNPTLSAPLSPTDPTIYFSAPPYDHTGTIITGGFLMGVKNSDSYVMTCWIAPGAVAADGLSATVVQGVRLEGLDYTTSDSTLIPADGFSAGDAISCNISGIIDALISGAIKGTIATNGIGFIIGDGTNTNGTISHKDATSTKGWLRKNPTTAKVEYSNDGTSWNTIDAVSTSNLVVVSAADTTPGNLYDKIEAEGDLIKTIENPGANENIKLSVNPNSFTSREGTTAGDPVSQTGVSGQCENTVIKTLARPIAGYIRKIQETMTYFGDATTQFDITNPSGTTFRYTYDATGTDPVISSSTLSIGDVVEIFGFNFSAGNNVHKAILTGVGLNYFEITNASGVVESNKTLGGESTVDSGATTNIRSTYVDENIVGAIYTVGTVSYVVGIQVDEKGEQTISTPVSLGATTGYCTDITSPDASRIVAVYRNGTDSKVYAVIVPFTGATPGTAGTAVELGTCSGTTQGYTAISMINKVTPTICVAYRDTSDSNKGKVVAAEIGASGTTIDTPGSAVEILTTATGNDCSSLSVTFMATDRVLALLIDENNSSFCKASTIVATGTVLSPTTEATFYSVGGSSLRGCYVEDNKAIAVWIGASSYVYQTVFTLTGLVLSYPTALPVNALASATPSVTVTNTTKAFVVYEETAASDGKINELTIGTTGAQIGTQNTLNGSTNNVAYTSVVKLNSRGTVYVSYRDEADSNKYNSEVYQSYDNSTYCIGFAQSTVVTGASVNVRSTGVDSNQLGLEIGSIYYVADGGVSTINDSDIEVGISKTSTTLGIGLRRVKASVTPVTRVYEVNTTLLGSNDSQFDITQAGTETTYTWDGTGTDPVISAATIPIGTVMECYGSNFAAGNKGAFTVIASGDNYFTVTNAGGTSETNKTLNTGYLAKRIPVVWVKPVGLTYLEVEMEGACGGGVNASGAKGGYARKIFDESGLTNTVSVIVGAGGRDTTACSGTPTLFGSYITCNSGTGAVTTTPGTGGTATGGDLNITGQNGYYDAEVSPLSVIGYITGPGGAGAGNAARIILTEHF